MCVLNLVHPVRYSCRSTRVYTYSSPTPAPTRLQDTITLWLFGIFENQTYRRNVERLLLLEHASRTIHDRPSVGSALSSSFRKKYRVRGCITAATYHKISRFAPGRGPGWPTIGVHTPYLNILNLVLTIL